MDGYRGGGEIVLQFSFTACIDNLKRQISHESCFDEAMCRLSKTIDIVLHMKRVMRVHAI